MDNEDDDNAETTKIRSIWRKRQNEIASQVKVLPDATPAANQRFSKILTSPLPLYIGGVDVSFPNHATDPSIAVYVVLKTAPGGMPQVVYEESQYFTLTVPYIPSFLAFRELDPLVELILQQRERQPSLTPSVIYVDGNGIFHPRKAGIATCLGCVTGIPTIGIGKTLYEEGGLTKALVDQGLQESLSQRIATSTTATTTTDKDEFWWRDNRSISSRIASVAATTDVTKSKLKVDLREWVEKLPDNCRGVGVPLAIPSNTDASAWEVAACALVGHGGRGAKNKVGGTKVPIYVSVGHAVSLEQAVTWTVSLSYTRIPEPIRQADLRGRDMLRQKEHPESL